MPYQFPKALQDEIDQFKGDDPGQVGQEIALLRFLINQAVRNGQIALSNNLISTLGKLSGVHIANQVRAGEMLERSTLVQISQRMVEAIVRRLEGVPNYTQLADELAADFSVIINDQRRLTYERNNHDLRS